ncbi:MAG: hypothetical protein WC459_01260 [Patescibacteria group bacterium]
MDKNNNLSFPHPVLGIKDDVLGEYKINCGVKLGKENILIITKHILYNETLEEMIKNKEAAFCVEVLCPRSIYRKSFLSSDISQTVKIKASDLRDRVEVNFYVNALKDVPRYKLKEANSDYSGFSFEIEKGDILAYGGNTFFIAEKTWEALQAVSSFMEIRKYEKKTGPLLFNLSAEKIIIELSETDYGKYQKIQNIDCLAPIFHSSIVLGALMYALGEMMSHGDFYKDYKWYQVLEFKMQNEERLKKIGWDVENLPHIAQIILDNPLARSMDALSEITSLISRELKE